MVRIRSLCAKRIFRVRIIHTRIELISFRHRNLTRLDTLCILSNTYSHIELFAIIPRTQLNDNFLRRRSYNDFLHRNYYVVIAVGRLKNSNRSRVSQLVALRELVRRNALGIDRLSILQNTSA